MAKKITNHPPTTGETAPAGGAPAPAAMPPAPLRQSAAAWETRFVAQAQAEHTDGDESNADPKLLLGTARAIASLAQTVPEHAARLARKGIDHEFQSAAGRIADRLAKATAAVPDDLRRAVVVTPDERKAIDDAANDVSDLRKSLGDAGRSVGAASTAHAFVTGGSVRPTAGSTRAAIKLLLQNAEGHAALVADAGIGEEELAHLARLDATLEKIETTKETRIALRDKLVGAETVAMIAVERMANLFRARVRTACLSNRVAMKEVLDTLPRSPDRRTRSAPSAPNGGETPATDAPASQNAKK